MVSTEIDEWGDFENPIGPESDPNFPMRRTSENGMVHDAAYAWWKSPNGREFVQWYEYATAAFKSGRVKPSLHQAAVKVEKTVIRLPSIKKLIEDFTTPDNGVEMTWGKLGELVFLKSQFWALKTPEEKNARAIWHKTKTRSTKKEPQSNVLVP
jgi:hypothetical protein